ncbi:MAG TPA: alcohol dehydrogenase catalytic domain-containing protein [Nonomuraea sp.]|nr:alcohol dehydrogenase catalytic domain-containing protein [Nonomuraea sp.]
MTTMKGAFLPSDFTAVLREVEVPSPGPGQLLVRVGASGICGSDLSYIYRGHKTHVGQEGPAYKGVVAGHEPSGQVVAAGPGLPAVPGRRPGHRLPHRRLRPLLELPARLHDQL